MAKNRHHNMLIGNMRIIAPWLKPAAIIPIVSAAKYETRFLWEPDGIRNIARKAKSTEMRKAATDMVNGM